VSPKIELPEELCRPIRAMRQGLGREGIQRAYEALILADRAAQLADKRQEFLDRAAMRLYAMPPSPTQGYPSPSPDHAYREAELLWAEREKRRLAKAEDSK
jgi:hypothetical protein